MRGLQERPQLPVIFPGWIPSEERDLWLGVGHQVSFEETEWKRLVSTSYGGWAANPTDVLTPQWYGVNREEMVLQVTEEENSVTVLLPVAPKRCGRGAESYSYPENGLEVSWEWQSAAWGNHTMEDQPCVAEWTEQTRWHAATFKDNSGCQRGGFHDQRQDGQLFILGGTHTQGMVLYGFPALTPLPPRVHPKESKGDNVNVN